MKFRILGTLVVLLFATVLAFAQGGYSPRPGETVMRLAVEGRGNIFILLYTKEAPKTTAHIIKLAKSGFYDGQRFHKVIKSPRPYLAQIGDPGSKTNVNAAGGGGTGEHIPYEETRYSNDEGAVGLARISEDRDSGDSQFYMLLAPAKFLDGKYTVFGKIVSGMDVLKSVELGDRVTSASILTG